MNLRIMGTSEEVKELVELLPAILNVKNVSKEYPNRGSKAVRVYVDCSLEDTAIGLALKDLAKEKIGSCIIFTDCNDKFLTSTGAVSKKSLLDLISNLSENGIDDQLEEILSSFKDEIIDKNPCEVQ